MGLRAGPGVSRGCGSGRLGGSLPLNCTKRLAIFLLFSPPTHACGGLCCFHRLCRLYCCRRRRHCRLCRVLTEGARVYLTKARFRICVGP